MGFDAAIGGAGSTVLTNGRAPVSVAVLARTGASAAWGGDVLAVPVATTATAAGGTVTTSGVVGGVGGVISGGVGGVVCGGVGGVVVGVVLVGVVEVAAVRVGGDVVVVVVVAGVVVVVAVGGVVAVVVALVEQFVPLRPQLIFGEMLLTFVSFALNVSTCVNP